MAEYNELYGAQKDTELKPYDKDEWLKQKQENRTAAFEMIDQTAASLTDISMLNTYLDVQSRFDRYSVSNALLVAKQRPDATRLCDSKQWQKNGAFINKGEKGIIILEPGEKFKKDDGSYGISFNAKKVFDVTQTNAEVNGYQKKQHDITKVIKAVIKTSPVPVNISNDLPQGINAKYYPEKKVILIRQGLDGNDIFRALSFEIAMAGADKGNNFNRSNNETYAYCVSYIVCKRKNVEPLKPYVNIKPFNGKDTKSIRAELGKIRDEANRIDNYIEKVLEPKDKGAR